MIPHVVLEDPAGQAHVLVHGDLVGRVWSAALPLDDGRVSEAHAMVSLREGQLQLIALRGRLAVDGEPATHIALRPGLELTLARGVNLRVQAVRLPAAVLGVEAPGLPRQVLPGVCSVLLEPAPRLSAGWVDRAALHLWSTGERWMARVPGQVAHPVEAGDLLPVGPGLRVVEIPLGAAGPEPTRRAGELDGPLTVVAAFDTVHVHRSDGAPVSFGGVQARLLSELVALGGPVAWDTLACELWPDEPESHVRRARLDTQLSRLRRRLRAAGVRADLVRTDGAGAVELFLYPHDRVDDRT